MAKFFKHLLLEPKENQGWIFINRPQALNALDRETIQEFKEAVKVWETDLSVALIVLTGSGDKAFAAGADISEIRKLNAEEALQFAKEGQDCMSAIERCEKPVVAAVNGYALGGGMELALACDFVYAAETAIFGLPEVSLGIFPGWGGTQRLSRLIGRNKARELIYTGRKLPAAEALAWGIVNQVVPRAELQKAVQTVAGEIGSKGPKAVALAKKAINEGSFETLEEGLAIERKLWAECFKTEDALEGLAAFLEKRKPNFKGK